MNFPVSFYGTIFDILSDPFSESSYRSVVVGVGVATVAIFAATYFSNSESSKTREFWNNVITDTKSNSGNEFSTTKLQSRKFFTADSVSEYVKKYLINSAFKGNILDLGSGAGANSVPLALKEGCVVYPFDNNQTAVNMYNEKIIKLKAEGKLKGSVEFPENDQGVLDPRKVGDITGTSFQNTFLPSMDAVICVDTLPYIDPIHHQRVLKKIHSTLTPSGKFIGTIFFKKEGDSETGLHRIWEYSGAHFYRDAKVARKAIEISGFKIIESRIREEGSMCFEFCAEKI